MKKSMVRRSSELNTQDIQLQKRNLKRIQARQD